MKTLFNVAIILVALSVGSIVLTTKASSAQVWEYKFEYKCTEKKANELGADGWELVDAPFGGSSLFTTCSFKRPK